MIAFVEAALADLVAIVFTRPLSDRR